MSGLVEDQPRAVRAGEELDEKRLAMYLWNDLGVQGLVSVQQFPGGHSNLTYLVRHGDKEYVLRRPPHTLVGERYDGEQVVPGEGMMRMRILPTGCMLINMRVFDDLPEPYFQTPVLLRKDKDGHEALQEVGEDVDFCERLIAKGRQIWCDMTLTRKVGHVAKVVLTVDGIMRGMEVQQKLATAKAPTDG